MKKENLTLIKNDDDGHTNFGMLDKIFEFGKIQIRVELDKAGEPWFVANDICKALGYTNPRAAIGHHVYSDDVDQIYTIDAIGRKQKTNVVNEKGLYALIFGSEKKRAKDFKNWVFSEVLPAIRQRGMYLSEEKQQQLEVLERKFTKLVAELQAVVMDQEKKIEAMTATKVRKRGGKTCKVITKLSEERTIWNTKEYKKNVSYMPVDAMNPEERDAFTMQHSSKVIEGSAKRMHQILTDRGSSDPELPSEIDLLKALTAKISFKLNRPDLPEPKTGLIPVG